MNGEPAWVLERAAAQVTGGGAVLLAAGDSIGASLFASSVAQDQPTIDVLNALQLKASAVGNHEFDRVRLCWSDYAASGMTSFA